MTGPKTGAPGALSHLRVLDLTRVLAGPWATQTLADMGAEVIKIERPDGGDDTRGWGPPFLRDAQGNATSGTAYHLSANRNKKSIAIDITAPEGQAIIRDLARTADVFVENHKVGAMAKYGLSYDELRAINPRLVYCAITGFGQSGPYAARPGYDFLFQGMSGLMSLTGFAETPDGSGGPVKSGIAIGDLVGGMYATTAILAALEFRNRSGQGQYIDLSLLDCMVSLMSYQAQSYLLSGKVPKALGNTQPNLVPYQTFDCRDGKIIIAVGNDSQFASLCAVAGRPDLAADPRYRTVSARRENRSAVTADLQILLREKAVAEWVDLLTPANVPCGPVYNLEQVFEDPHVAFRGIRGELDHYGGGKAPNVGNPIRFSETPVHYIHAAPKLGEHTRSVLNEVLNYDPSRLRELFDSGIVA